MSFSLSVSALNNEYFGEQGYEDVIVVPGVVISLFPLSSLQSSISISNVDSESEQSVD